MPSETPPGAPPSSIPRDVTAADLLTLLERLPPGELAAVPLAAKRLTESFAELDELIRRHIKDIERTIRLQVRVGNLLQTIARARPEKWAARPGGKVPNEPPNGTRKPQDRPEGG